MSVPGEQQSAEKARGPPLRGWNQLINTCCGSLDPLADQML